VLVPEKRDLAATRRFFIRALDHGPRPSEVATDRAPAYPRVLDELMPGACHVVEQYASNPVKADHGRVKVRLRPMRGLKRLRSTRVISTGHAFIQNLAAVTTNSAWTSVHGIGSRWPSPNSPTPSDHSSTPASHTYIPPTQQSQLADFGCTAVALTPGWMRSEMMLENHGVTEANWRDALARPTKPPYPDPGHFGISETPTYTGRAVAALAADPNLAR
jgi:hypothetical protein